MDTIFMMMGTSSQACGMGWDGMELGFWVRLGRSGIVGCV